MPSNQEDNLYYPVLSDIVHAGDLPEFLGFIKDGVQDMLDKVYYKDYESSKSIDGNSAFYSLKIVSRKKLALELPGTGIFFVLNPDYSNSSISSFPISVFWEWQVLQYIRNFKLSSFSFTPDAFFNLALDVFGISKVQVLKQAISTFVVPRDPSISYFEQLVADINLLYGADIVIDDDDEDKIERLITEVELLNKNVFTTVFVLYLLADTPAATFDKLNYFFSSFVPTDLQAYIKDILTPKVRATLTLNAAVEFPRNVLVPMKQIQGKWEIDNSLDSEGNPIKSYFKFAEADFYVDTAGGIGSDVQLGGTLSPEYAQIGNTGLIVKFTNGILDLSSTTNIPQANAAGYPVDFMGLYVEEASIRLIKFGTEDTSQTSVGIIGTDLLIGSGGFSGTVTLASDGRLYRKFGNFAVELNEFSMSFHQNSITSSAIKGKLTIPKFKLGSGNAIIGIEASIKDDGDFSIKAIPQSEPLKITFPNVFELEVYSMSMGSVDGRFFVAVSGKLSFTANIPVLGKILPENIEINKLLIWEDGDIEFEGGSLMIPKSFGLKVGPVNLEVSNISFAAYKREFNGVERSYRYFGFDGMVNTGRSGINTKGNGIKYYFTVDDGPFDNFIGIDGIEIDMSIPGGVSRENAMFTLNGFLSVSNPSKAGTVASTEYTGSVSFAMPKLRIGGSAGMRMDPSVPAFLVDIGLELATPIPLGATGLGIYGMRGLIGQHYKPAKSATTPPLPEDATWWEYYKAKPEGIHVSKFASQPGFTVGAGISLATSFDSGKVFSSKLFLMLGLPKVLVILEGQAGMLRQRIGLDDKVDPPFKAMIAFDDQSVQGNLSVNFNLPDDGWIFKMQGMLEMAFFFNNASGWYLNVGRDQPESARVRSEILTLFNGYAYLMLSSKGIRAGAGIRFDLNKKFGPVGVGFGAYMNLGGHVSFKPVQIGGFIEVGGYAYLRISRFGLGLSIALGLAVEAPKPFVITGSMDISLRIVFFRVRFKFDLTWTFNRDERELQKAVPILELPDLNKGYLPAAAINILSNESFRINYVKTDSIDNIPLPGDGSWALSFDSKDVTVPLDSFIDIELLKPVLPNGVRILGGAENQLPVAYRKLIPPQKGVSNQYEHRYVLDDIKIVYWDGTWKNYNVYEAVTAIVDANNASDKPIVLSSLKQGYWQFNEPGKFNKIRLLSQNMFSYNANNPISDTDIDHKNFGEQDVFCFESIMKEKSINWKEEELDTVYPAGVAFDINNYQFTLSGVVSGSVQYSESYTGNSLQVAGQLGKLEITMPKPLGYVKLRFSDNHQNIKVSYFEIEKTVVLKRLGPFFIPRIEDKYKLITEKQVFKTELKPTVELAENLRPVHKVVLEFNTPISPDYEGNVVMGGYLRLPDQYAVSGLDGYYRNIEAPKAMAFVTFYNRSFSGQEVKSKKHHNQLGTVAQWPMDSSRELYGNRYAVISGTPDKTEGYYDMNGTAMQRYKVYSFAAKTDALIAFYRPEYKVENSSFAFELTAIFSPFTLGISTLLYKIKEDNVSGFRTGYALHLCRNTVLNPNTAYTDMASLPEYSLWFTCYKEDRSWGIKVTDKFTVDCDTSKLTGKQYKNVFVNADRQSGQLEIYVDRVLKSAVQIPTELSVFDTTPVHTMLNELVYVEQETLSRIADADLTKEKMDDELRILDDAINRTIQPVWKPNTIFAVKLTTVDYVNNAATAKKYHVFGFKTAGPIGHFHQQSKKYDELKAQDRQDEFKLAGLKHYINYERSYPDAQGRFDLSKPVFCNDPQIKLFFNQPYVNAMFYKWDQYGTTDKAIESKLELQLADIAGNITTEELIWEDPIEVPITQDNLDSLSEDMKILYRLNQSAQECGSVHFDFKKRIRQGSYIFPDLQPNQLYTAIFNSVYKIGEQAPSVVEVHKFSLLSSRFEDFQSQAHSYVLDDTAGAEIYAIEQSRVSFSTNEINNRIKPLITGTPTGSSQDLMRYAVKFDRLIYGGLKMGAFEPVEHSMITLIVNIDPANIGSRRLLGIVIRNPEPFNDPKYTDEILKDTVSMTMTSGGNILQPDSFKYIHSGNTSAVLITNEAMDIPVGEMQFKLRYKLFNGIEHTIVDTYESGVIDLRRYVV